MYPLKYMPLSEIVILLFSSSLSLSLSLLLLLLFLLGYPSKQIMMKNSLFMLLLVAVMALLLSHGEAIKFDKSKTILHNKIRAEGIKSGGNTHVIDRSKGPGSIRGNGKVKIAVDSNTPTKVVKEATQGL